MHLFQVIVPSHMIDEDLLPASHITGDPCFDAVIDQCRNVVCVGKMTSSRNASLSSER